MKLRDIKTKPKKTCFGHPERVVIVSWRRHVPGIIEYIKWDCYWDDERKEWMEEPAYDEPLSPEESKYGQPHPTDGDCWFYYNEVEELIISMIKDEK